MVSAEQVGDTNIVSDNDASGNTNGIEVSGDDNEIGAGNVASGNDENGILLTSTAELNDVHDNTADGNGASPGGHCLGHVFDAEKCGHSRGIVEQSVSPYSQPSGQ